MKLTRIFLVLAGCVLFFGIEACKPDEGPDDPVPPVIPTDTFDINSIVDDYSAISDPVNALKWGSYNVHDPSIFKSGEYYYCYNTDVAWGHEVKPGIQIRRSKDLVEWKFMGWVFDNIPAMGAQFIEGKGGEPFQSLWAPYAMKVGDEYRLYYSLTCSLPRLSMIGLATASHPLGPWTEKGLVVTSINNSTRQTNAIDPTVVVTPSGEHWFYYGSAWDGIYMLQLDPATGLAANPGTKGRRVAQRGFTGSTINGNIEGPEVVYNADFGKYYMFIAYDWLQTKYNTRVGRSDNPDGPFYDINGNDMNIAQDDVPMIIAPYKFAQHSGWQGVAHCAVFNDGNGQWYMAHQGRPGFNSYFMHLHVRKMYWTEDGWPLVSPERYAGLEQTAVTESEIAGKYEQIVLGYRVVPGFDQEQTSPDFQVSTETTLGADGSINGDASQSWSWNAPWLTLNWNGGWVDKLYVERGRDWERKVPSTLIMTGLNNESTAIWLKKIE
ncbi:MAG: arabinan endo-1,5-alpha-L-arabinosidase [Bacteroidia bacterium]